MKSRTELIQDARKSLDQIALEMWEKGEGPLTIPLARGSAVLSVSSSLGSSHRKADSAEASDNTLSDANISHADMNIENSDYHANQEGDQNGQPALDGGK